MKSNDISNVLRAANRGPASNVNQNDLFPDAVEYCVSAGLVRAVSVTLSTSSHPEYSIREITPRGKDYLESSRLPRKLSDVLGKRWIPILGGAAAILTITTAVVHWWRRK
jgi:hypothetical protein